MEDIKNYLEGLSQDELYALLIEYGLKGLTKLNSDEEGRIILDGVKDDNSQ